MVQPAQDISCGTKHRPPGQPQPNPLSYYNPNPSICYGGARDSLGAEELSERFIKQVYSLHSILVMIISDRGT